ncbi:MAG: hypothetical protein ACJAXJ_003544 [Colwellia sp.]|jgi:hypothetical protein
MQTDTNFRLKENGFSAEIFISETTLVLNETGGLCCRPLYIVLIRNSESLTAYRLKNVSFFSQCYFNQDGNSYIWSDAEAAAESLAAKVQVKGIVNMALWQLYTPKTD